MREEIRIWYEQAKHDLEVAEKNLSIDEYYVTSFFCQQSIEKILKAYIMLTKKESPGHIHSLIKLAKIGNIPEKYFLFLKKLTSEYYLTRYPDALEDIPYQNYTKEEAEETLKNTKEVFEWISTQIKK